MDLALLPIASQGSALWICRKAVSLPRDYALLALLDPDEQTFTREHFPERPAGVVRPVTLPEGVSVQLPAEFGGGQCWEDPYGTALTWIRAEQLMANWSLARFSGGLYLKQPVVLYWF